MDAKVDWFSATLPLNLSGGGGRSHHVTDNEIPHDADASDAFCQQQIAEKMAAYGLDDLLNLMASSKYTDMGKRKRYGRFLHWRKNNISLLWGGEAKEVLLEMSGVSCQLLRDEGALNTTIAALQDRATRLDIAVDFPDAPCKPRDFVGVRENNRFTVTEQHDTKTGLSQYVGSQKSDRYAVCYVYEPPHPRAGVMRVEHRLKAEYAKITAAHMLKNGLPETVSVLGNTFGWKHAVWQPQTVTDGKIRAQRHDKDDAGTLRWLITAVAPAMRKAQESGLIDVLDFVEEYVLKPLQTLK